MNQLHINDHVLELPSNINDLSRPQILDLANVILTQKTGIEALWWLFLSLLGQKRRYKQQLWAAWHLRLKPFLVRSWLGRIVFVWLGVDVTLIEFSEEQIYDCITLYTDFLFTNKAPLVMQRFKYVRLGLRWFVGPDDALEGFTFAQWREAEAQYHQYATEKDEAALNRLMAVLYYQSALQRFFSWLTNRPIRLSESQLQRRTKQMAKLDERFKMAILLYFQGSKELIVDTHKHFFVKGKKAEGDSNYSIEDAYQATLHHISNRDPEQYERKDMLPLYYVLFALEQNGIEAERLKKEYEDLKNKNNK